ncbi:MAG: type II toxin-antitoxin system RelE/ParE family toxin [Rhodomicrobium sp.]
MIKGFKDARAAAIFEGRDPGKGFPAGLIRPARRKLIMLAEARSLADLRSPPANTLEPLKGDRMGQYSIGLNEQFRLCFTWTGSDAEDVEIADYH